MLTLAAVKSKLEIPDAVQEVNSAVEAALEAAKSHFTEETGFRFTAATGIVEYFRAVRPGRDIQLKHIPVSAIASVEAKASLGGSYVTVPYDLVDPTSGALVVLPSGSVEVASISRIGKMIDSVRVTYSVSAYSPPAHVAEAIEALAAFMYQQDRRGPLTSSSEGGISRTTETAPFPERVERLITSLRRPRARVY